MPPAGGRLMRLAMEETTMGILSGRLRSAAGGALGSAALMVLAAIGGAVQAAELTGTLKKINEAGTITIGYREASTPFSFLDSDKRPAGYAIDLCLKVVDEVKAMIKRPDLAVR